MASTAAAYHKPQPALTLEVRSEQISKSKLTAGQVARTLDELIDLGFIEKFRDEFGATRFRPVYGRGCRAGSPEKTL
jgi:DNA-binding MarR family transcriptional regulator